MSKEVERLQELIDQYDNIVFFGGAGVSTESGIPDFRSQDGLYNQKYDYPPETILSHTFFMGHPEEFYRFYQDKMLCDTAKPNAAHLKLAELEEAGKLICNHPVFSEKTNVNFVSVEDKNTLKMRKNYTIFLKIIQVSIVNKPEML